MAATYYPFHSLLLLLTSVSRGWLRTTNLPLTTTLTSFSAEVVAPSDLSAADLPSEVDAADLLPKVEAFIAAKASRDYSTSDALQVEPRYGVVR